jgi:anti-sigma B factor antagonist
VSSFSYDIEATEPPLARVEGEIDLAAVDGFEGAIAALSDRCAGGDAAIDMADVSFLDSSGLRMLMKAHQQWVDAGATLTIVNPSSAVARIIEITGLVDTLHLDGTWQTD